MLECWNAGIERHDRAMRDCDVDILRRTTAFAVRVIHLVDALPRRTSCVELGRQLMRSAASIGAHCREARRARSTAEFRSKIAVAQQEAEETVYWLQLIVDADIITAPRIVGLQDEAAQLLAMLIAAERTASCAKR
ncbi:MAG TPA: four helix bundle protein [Planctomycetes bacterium]|nr:four helix bundle protein [Planctomycetota bacterium]